ncbi:transcriptional regulator WhiB [Sphaerisporangium krabiense]|uniref:Transcriptional regulator WhiB n=1 Tax=Sphaerisporangium krabiense TaxID=763782 RepID=A0A7W8YZZ8_9ACTN|nr:WhiB family transcriptional regulator [Sphaerisporangium krabiense]MBB5624845.1 WhiB family redox-sensing transcriptional regulator [Sphaerisporangium krabiense]GII66454.1 transcriptional regulator WhiB [Sphaerisporangium krabiense]
MGTRAVREASWASRGACRGADPELFFPEAPFPEQEARAKAVCAACPVILECRAYAVRAGERDGIWGGLTTDERRRLRFPPGWGRRAAS